MGQRSVLLSVIIPCWCFNTMILKIIPFLHQPLHTETILKNSQWWLQGFFLVVAVQLQLAFTAHISVSCKHDLDYWSLDVLPCIYWYRPHLFLFLQVSFVRFPWGFLQSLNLLTTQDRLTNFTVHCLAQVLVGHNWRQSHGVVAPKPSRGF